MMKKLVLAALASVVLVGTVGCNKNTLSVDIDNPLGPSAIPTAVTGVSVYMTNKSIDLNNCSATVSFGATVQPAGASQTIDDWKTTGGVLVKNPNNVPNTAQVTFTPGDYAVTATAQGKSGSETIRVSGSGSNCGAVTIDPKPQCSDGVDNDNDGKVDYPADPGCSSASDNDERDSTGPVTPTPAPTVTLTAFPTSISQGGKTRLTWSSTNATFCTKSGDWSGTALTSGSEEFILGVVKLHNYTMTCTGSGGTSAPDSETVNVTAPACPNTIDYSPKGGTVSVGTTFALKVDNWPSGVSCVPYWYSGDPSRIGILGADEIWVAPNGAKYFAGVNAQAKAWAVGNTPLSTQTSIAINWVSRSYTWVVKAGSGLMYVLGIEWPDPPLPKYNIYNTPGVKQTPPWVK